MRHLAAFAVVPSLILSAAPALAPAAARARKPAPSYRILPGPYAKGGPTEEKPPTATRFTLQGVTVTVDVLGAEERAAFVRSIDAKAPDLFAARPGRPEFYRTFLVAFENGSKADVVFQPGNVILVTDRGEQQGPIDSTDLYMAAERAGAADADLTLDRARPFIFDSSTLIPRGARLARLLVFGPLPEKWKEFRLHFSFLQIGTETHTLSFTFHKQVLGG